MAVFNLGRIRLVVGDTRRELAHLLLNDLLAELGPDSAASLTIHLDDSPSLAAVGDACLALQPSTNVAVYTDTLKELLKPCSGKSCATECANSASPNFFALSPNTANLNDGEKEAELRRYADALRRSINRSFLVFSGDETGHSCSETIAYMSNNWDVLFGSSVSSIVCYCDVFASHGLKSRIAQAVLEKLYQGTSMEKNQAAIPHEYYHSILSTAPVHLPWRAAIPDYITSAMKEKIDSKMYTVSGPSYFANTRVLLFSPHPDDDVIAAGLLLQHLNQPSIEAHVAYCVTGHGAVRDSFLDLLVDDKTVMMSKKTAVREKEATDALKVLGIPSERAHFLRLPFYGGVDTKRRRHDQTDVDIIKSLLNTVQPDHIFVAGDFSDPHRTHEECYYTIKDTLEDIYHDCYRELRKEDTMGRIAESVQKASSSSTNTVPPSVDSIKSAIYGPANFLQCTAIQSLDTMTSVRKAIHTLYGRTLPILWMYRGSWDTFSPGEASLIITGNAAEMQRKQGSIQAHASQMGAAMFMGKDARSFDVRAMERGTEAAERLRALGVNPLTGVESYLCSFLLL